MLLIGDKRPSFGRYTPRMSVTTLLTILVSLVTSVGLAQATTHAAHQVEGWTIHVDERLLQPDHAALGKTALALLQARLADIVTVLPKDKVPPLQKVPIWLELDSRDLTSMQYHPSAKWLTDNGHSASLARAVHIPVAAQFVSARHQHIQPWSLLHELAHAYHDQALGFDEPRIAACWEAYQKSGHGDRSLHVTGRRIRHYALTNHKEFFAEMTEAYFGVNDFYPFVHGELKTAEPSIHHLLQEIWGKTALD
ncbi:metallopeptidase [Prosthecobacter algae]|uniref:Metallopeptidase n=2 Tax=Prosthecobacter algae TaxID=1144682 RepID=A0ABP9NUT0_9BACT